HAILQKLHDQFAVKRVHLLICASNAACVFVGQAFDLYQPALLVYDFDGDEMRAKLSITHVKGKVTLSIP
ncbi:SAVED domain-containing protein, partial [Shewanella chilikensis]